jgi:hypothetical protein
MNPLHKLVRAGDLEAVRRRLARDASGVDE